MVHGTQSQLLAIAGPCETNQTPKLAPLIEDLRQHYGKAVVAIIYYGSCLRSGQPYDGLIDLYVIVDAYTDVHRSGLGAWLNAVLPPTVYYREHETAEGILRCKYALLSIAQLEHGARQWFQAGVWGRFSQPVAIVHARSEDDRTRIRHACGAAVVGLLCRALPALDSCIEPTSAFAQALTMSYACELRVERQSRGTDFVTFEAAEYRRRFLAALPMLPFRTHRENSETVDIVIPLTRRRLARVTWPLRRVQGKAVSILRLAKACFTFSDAVDYAAWKIQRHTGTSIAVSPRLRRYPLIFGWPILWRLYRKRHLR